MILDTQTTFSGAIAADGTLTAQGPITATQISTNVLDLRQSNALALADEGISGPELYMIVSVGAAFNNLTSLTITIESDSAAALNVAPIVHFSQTVLLAALTQNTTVLRVQLPVALYKRYLGLRYTVNGTAPTTGSLLAEMTLDIQRNVIYPTGITIDV